MAQLLEGSIIRKQTGDETIATLIDINNAIDSISVGPLSNYIGFEIDEDMNLIMTTPDNYYGPEFILENGELKVVI